MNSSELHPSNNSIAVKMEFTLDTCLETKIQMSDVPADLYGRGYSRRIDDKVHLEFCDDYDHPDGQIEYIVENVLMEAPLPVTSSYELLANLYNSIYSSFCECKSTSCGLNSALHCFHGANYIVHTSTSTNQCELVLNPNRRSHDLIYECSSLCKCDPVLCTNRLVQFGPRKHLQITTAMRLQSATTTDRTQLRVLTTLAIPAGAFVCEYAGEVLTIDEAHTRHSEQKQRQHRRHLENQTNDYMNYIICLNEYSLGTKENGSGVEEKVAAANTHTVRQQTFIDPSRRGNIGRYLNHSCDANCEILSVRVDGQLPKLGIFAKRDIVKGEEMCFDYGTDGDNNVPDLEDGELEYRTRCLCGTDKCRQYLPYQPY